MSFPSLTLEQHEFLWVFGIGIICIYIDLYLLYIIIRFKQSNVFVC